jgi:hypothetical protein
VVVGDGEGAGGLGSEWVFEVVGGVAMVGFGMDGGQGSIFDRSSPDTRPQTLVDQIRATAS